MKRLIALLVLVLVAFYGAWPAWNGHQISQAIKAKDAATLERKISFSDVRDSLKPLAIQKVGEVYDQQLKAQVGPAGASIVNQIKNDVVPKIVDQALASLVTAPNLIRVVNDGGSIKENAERILKEQVSKIGLPGIGGIPGIGNIRGGSAAGGSVKLPGGLAELAGKIGIPGLGAPAPSTSPAPAAEKEAAPATAGVATAPPKFSYSNIKRFAVIDPLAFEVGVARDQAAKDPDVVVEMRFVGGDWRVMAVRPRI